MGQAVPFWQFEWLFYVLICYKFQYDNMEEVLLMKSLWCAALAVAVTLGGCGIAEPGTEDQIGRAHV